MIDRTGSSFVIRPIRPCDAQRLVEFHEALSPQSTYLRYFAAHPHLSDTEVHHLTEVDYRDRLALVALRHDRIIGVCRYERLGASDRAEIAFVVADECQHHGIGGLLLDALAEAARQRGIGVFTAQTLVGNLPMLEVFFHSGYPVKSSTQDGVVDLTIPIDEVRAPSPGREGGERPAAPDAAPVGEV